MLDFNRRFNTYVNGIQAEKQQLEALATNLEGQAYNVTATKGQELQKGILKFYRGDKDSGVTRTFKGNKAYYTMNIGGQEVTKSLEDIADGIIPKDVKTRGKFDTDLQVIGRSAAKGQKFDAIGAKKTAETLLESSPDKIKTLQDFFHTEHRGQTGTLAQGLSTGQGSFGKISAQLFTVLNKNGLLQEYDTEKTPGKITKEDFEGKNAAKYMQLVDDITSGKNYDLSKKIASELYADVVAKDEHERLKFVPNEEEDGLKLLKSTGSSFIGSSAGNGYVKNSSLNSIARKVNNRETIDLAGQQLVWNQKDAYELVEGDGKTSIIPNKASLFSTLYGNNFDPVNILDVYGSIKDWQADTRIEEDVSKSLNIDINTLKKDDNDVALELNKFLPPIRDRRNPKGYVFYTTQMGQSEGISFERGGGDMSKESVTLYQIGEQGDGVSFKGPDGYFIKPVVLDNEIVELKTGGNLQRRQNTITSIDQLFENELKNVKLNKPRP